MQNSAVRSSPAQKFSILLLLTHGSKAFNWCAAALSYRDKVKCQHSFQHVCVNGVHPVYL